MDQSQVPTFADARSGITGSQEARPNAVLSSSSKGVSPGGNWASRTRNPKRAGPSSTHATQVQTTVLQYLFLSCRSLAASKSIITEYPALHCQDSLLLLKMLYALFW